MQRMRKIPYILAALLILPFYVLILGYLEIWHLEDLREQRRFRDGKKPWRHWIA